MPTFKLHKPLLYIVTLIIPQLLLGYFIYSAFDTPSGNTLEWKPFMTGWVLLLPFILGGIYLETINFLKGWALPIIIFITYGTCLLFMYESFPFYTIPAAVTNQINYEMLPLYLTIPGMFHALLDIILKYFRPDGTYHSNLKVFFYTILMPVGYYLFALIILPLHRGYTHGGFYLNNFFIKILVCIGIAFFLFFFLRFILGNIVGKNLTAENPIMIILFGLIFPFSGLLLHQEFSIFGDFNVAGIYIAAFVNGLGLLLLSHRLPKVKLIGFLCASFGIPYVLYFFIVFLPYIPLSVIAIIVFGAGILLLTPIVLLPIELIRPQHQEEMFHHL